MRQCHSEQSEESLKPFAFLRVTIWGCTMYTVATDPAEKQRVYDDSQYGKSDGNISRAIEDVAFFELTEVSAWIFGKETREYQW